MAREIEARDHTSHSGMRRLLALILTAGCGASTPLPQERPPPPAPAHVAERAGAYEVHEWGLVMADANDVLHARAIPAQAVPMVALKPVLYFHADELVSLSRVTVEASGGLVREHWPIVAPAPLPASVSWTGLSLDPGRGACPATFPAASDRPCADLPRGEHCEASELARVVAPDATCLGDATPMLFYRSDTRTFEPPLVVTREGDALRVDNRSDHHVPGKLVRLHVERGFVDTRAITPPGPHERTTFGADQFAREPGHGDVGREAVRTTMSEIGLTRAEIDAFLRAWDETLFAGATVALDLESSDPNVPPFDSILYFLPQQECDDIARLTFNPPPHAVRRAMAMWIRVP